jgi:hypothetical protein
VIANLGITRCASRGAADPMKAAGEQEARSLSTRNKKGSWIAVQKPVHLAYAAKQKK